MEALCKCAITSPTFAGTRLEQAGRQLIKATFCESPEKDQFQSELGMKGGVPAEPKEIKFMLEQGKLQAG
jgi:hypothetical protein